MTQSKQQSLTGGFANPVVDSQVTFRSIMTALSRPGKLAALRSSLTPPAPLSVEAAALALTLLDHETTLWLDQGLCEPGAVSQWLRFHAGVRLEDEPSGANFALISDPRRLPSLGSFARGTPDYPDQAATLVMQVESFDQAPSVILHGPGIREPIKFAPGPVSLAFWTELAASRASYPCGLDILFVARGQIAALPRSTRIAIPEVC